MFLIFEIMIEILVELYTSLNFGTNDSKAKRKVEKLGKNYPEIRDAYEKYPAIFEEHIELNKAILELNLKEQVQTKHVAKLIQTNITRIEASSKKF